MANIAELRVDFWDRRIQLYGSDNPDSLRGQYFDLVVLDEIADQNPKIWNEIVRPALADRKGKAIFIGTPKGQNHFKELRDRAEVEPDWCLLEFKASETGIVDAEELAAAKREMGDDKYAQEFECSFHAAIEGSYYGKIMNDLEAEHRFTEIKRDDLAKTFTAWDLGIGDSTAIWVAQMIGKEIRLLDYIENHGVGLEWYVRELRERDWLKAEHLLPHDVQAKELGTGKSRQELLGDLGMDVTVVPRLGVDDGIQAARRILPDCWFNMPQVKQGVECLRNYRREYDEKRSVFYDKPLHDWASHCFVGETEVLTRNGMCQIMNLPITGEVLTQCGWKQYINPRITRKNARLVEVVFKGGYTVRCTPDHKFLTANGWKSAESLTKGLLIQSTLTRSRSILMAAYTVYGKMKGICLGVVKNSIGLFGNLRLVNCQKDTTSTIKTATLQTTCFQTLSALKLESISVCQVSSDIWERKNHLPLLQEKKQRNGIAQKKGDCGTDGLLNGRKTGQNGSGSKCSALGVIRFLKDLFAKAAISKSIATQTAKPLFIETVRQLNQTDDVWCITVPEAEHFSLSNGAVVHNCADAFRYLAVGINNVSTSWSKPLQVNTRWIV